METPEVSDEPGEVFFVRFGEFLFAGYGLEIADDGEVRDVLAVFGPERSVLELAMVRVQVQVPPARLLAAKLRRFSIPVLSQKLVRERGVVARELLVVIARLLEAIVKGGEDVGAAAEGFDLLLAHAVGVLVHGPLSSRRG